MQYTIEDFLAHDCNREILKNIGIDAPCMIPIYHGSPNKICVPQYGLGEDKHDYGRGFYTTLYREIKYTMKVRPLTQLDGLIFIPSKDRNLKFSILKIDFHNIKKSKTNIKILSKSTKFNRLKHII